MYEQVLGIIATEIETQLKRDIKKFLMIYDYKNHTVEFKIDDDDKRLPLNDTTTLADGLKAWIESNVSLKSGISIQYAFILHEKGAGSKIDIHFINDSTGEKSTESVKV